MSPEAAPTLDRKIENIDLAHDMANASNELRSEATVRRMGAEMVKGLIEADVSGSIELSTKLDEARQNYGSAIVDYEGKHDAIEPKAANAAAREIFSDVSNGASRELLSPEVVKDRLANQAQVLDFAAEQKENAVLNQSVK